MSTIGHNGGPTFTDAGWVAIARSMRTHPLVGFHLHAKPADPSRGAMQPALAFIDLLMECRYEDGFVVNGGRKMEIKRGQMVGAISWLANRWNWTPMAVRIWFDKLTADETISRFVPGASKDNKHVGRAATIITLCNYDQYQSSTANRQQIEQQINNEQATNKQQQYNDNKGTKEQRNKKEEIVAADAVAVAVAPPSPSIDPYEPFRVYNEFALRIGLPVARTLTPSRRDNLCRRLKEHGSESWATALANIERSAFLRGNNDRKWKADFDFIVQAASYAKLVDGVYGNGAHAPVAKPPPRPPRSEDEQYEIRMRCLFEDGIIDEQTYNAR